MGWARLDDRWATHPKLLTAGLEASGLDARAISWCAGPETDGFVGDAVLVMLCSGSISAPHDLAASLVRVGRWHRDDDRHGYVVHDYLDYNQSHSAASAKRAADSERKAAYRADQPRGADGRIMSSRTEVGVREESGGSPHGQTADSVRIPGGVPPFPTRPDPTPNNSSSSSLNRVAAPAVDDDEKSRQEAARAVSLIADRRIALSRTAIANPRAYRSTLLPQIRDELGDDVARLLAEGASPAEVCDRLEPMPAPARNPAVPRRYEPEPPSADVDPAVARMALAQMREGVR